MTGTADARFNPLTDITEAGRVCPSDYGYSPSVFARSPDLTVDTLYVVGGLYGNLAALDAIEALVKKEATPPTIIFNGDFHWFNAETNWFADVERRVAPYRALRGNVETEIARDNDVGAGCGCAYPVNVDRDTVRRSNEILEVLRAYACPSAKARLQALPKHLVAHVGPLRIGIIHGDAQELAGWRFAPESLDDPQQRRWFDELRVVAQIDVFACTHTCLAALRNLDGSGGKLTIINNGAAGMPNFSGTQLGVITRIGTTPSPHKPLYGVQRNGIQIDALAVAYDHEAFLERFLKCWPEGSAAHASYYRRIVQGPDYSLGEAAPR
jgi:hypothetical protein